jgi:DNA (cytosine-5)-methyltransferase 1
MARVIREVLPPFAFVENSPLLIRRGLVKVLGDFAEMGYDAQWGVVAASDCGAPHKRGRIWILATLADPDRERE